MTAVKPRRVRIWALLDSLGRVRRVSNIRHDCVRYIVDDDRGRKAPAAILRDLRRCERDGWIVRRLRPEEVAQ